MSAIDGVHMCTPYKQQWSLEQRKERFATFCKRYPNNKLVPMIVEAGKHTVPIGKIRFAMTNDRKFNSLMNAIQQSIPNDTGSSQLTYIINGTIPKSDDTLVDLYQQHADIDGFLYITYTHCIPVVATNGTSRSGDSSNNGWGHRLFSGRTPSPLDLTDRLFYVPRDAPFGALANMIRARLTKQSHADEPVLTAEDALFYFINDVLPMHSQPMSIIHKEHVAPDGFVHVTYHRENTFG